MSRQFVPTSSENLEILSTSLVADFLSIDNFRLAWKKVAANQGSAGVDGETIDDFQQNLNVNLSQLIDAVASGTYQALPCKQVLLPKSKSTWREIKIPTVRDRIVQQALLNVLVPVIDNKFSHASFAYRPNLSYIDAVKAVARWRDLGYCWVLDADIAQYFDNIDRPRLLGEVRKYIDNPGVLCLIKSWIAVGVKTDSGVVFPEKGIPQGSVISPLLANIYLDEFDRSLLAADFQLVRYADDFLVLARTKEEIIQGYAAVENILDRIGLKLNSEKTRIANFDRGFRFLGHGFLETAIFPLESAKSQQQKESKVSKKKASRQKPTGKRNRKSY
jgi:RNA-directed DNA polymerase